MSERGKRRWLILGVGSAVLNVFLIGFLVGRQVLGPGGCDGGRGIGRPFHRHEFRQYVGAEDRKRLKDSVRDVRQAREAVREALTREPFDRARLEAALGTLRERTSGIQLEMHRVLLERASSLDADQRKRLAESRLLRPALGPGP